MSPTTDPTRYVLSILSLLALIGTAFWVVQPFLPATIWAGMIVIATWPALQWLELRLKGRRALAVAIMLVVLSLFVVLPIWLAISTVAEYGPQIANWGHDLANAKLPSLPVWVSQVPLVGEYISAAWVGIETEGFAAYRPQLASFASVFGKWLLSNAGGITMLVVHLLLTMAMATVFFLNGESMARGGQAFARRLAGEDGVALSRLASQAVRGVAMGLVITAIVQSLMAGFGLWLAGVPLVSLLIALAFMLTLAQIGPTVVLVPAVLWLFGTGETGWGVFLTVWTVIVGTLDNFLRPWLIQRGADLSFFLVFAGVMGGLLAFGLIGLFIGPVVLAVAWTLLRAWVGPAADASVVNQS